MAIESRVIGTNQPSARGPIPNLFKNEKQEKVLFLLLLFLPPVPMVEDSAPAFPSPEWRTVEILLAKMAPHALADR